MQITQTKDKDLEREFKVVMTAEEIDEQVSNRLKEIGETVNVPGFRPGKVPLNILKSKYGQAVMGEVLEKLVNDSSMKAINENNIKPAMQPKIEVKSFEEGKGLEYVMTVEILPEIKLADLKKIKLDKYVAEPDKKVIQESLDRIVASQKDFEDVKEKRVAKLGDAVVIDFDGSVDGKSLPGMKGGDYTLELGSNSFVDDFEEQLVGSTAGVHKKVTVTFPENYASKELAGKEAVFEVDVKGLKKVVSPKMDDELAKKLGFENLENLTEAVKSQIQSDYDQMTRLHVKRQLLDALDAEHKFDVPKGMLDAEYNSILHQVAHQNGEHEHGEHCDHEKDLSESEKKEYKDIAERRVRLGLVLAEIGKENNIEVSQAELQQAVINEARKYPGQEQQVFEYYQKNQQALESLRAPLYEEKTVDFILEICSVNENKVSFDELLELAKEAEKPLTEGKGGKKAKKSKSSGTAKKKASSKVATNKKTDRSKKKDKK